MNNFHREIKAGNRFQFGKNWRSFLSTLDEQRIHEAEKSLQEMLQVQRFEGLRFLDIGCGSGLFSLAARRLGAEVFSFDYDPQSVACAESLKTRFYPNDNHWKIEQGSALDEAYLTSLGQFDVVYSWGVLHHTGSMWPALKNASLPVKVKGKLFIAIYNDQGWLSRFWWVVKKIYCSNVVGRMLMCTVFLPYFSARAFAKSLLTGTNQWKDYKRERGMSLVHDWFDWLGGFPFEVASVEAISKFYQTENFSLVTVLTTKGWGNNQFVFSKN